VPVPPLLAMTVARWCPPRWKEFPPGPGRQPWRCRGAPLCRGRAWFRRPSPGPGGGRARVQADHENAVRQACRGRCRDRRGWQPRRRGAGPGHGRPSGQRRCSPKHQAAQVCQAGGDKHPAGLWPRRCRRLSAVGSGWGSV